MGDENSRTVIETLHQMELRMSERMVRVETELRQWRKDAERLRDVDETLRTDIDELRTDFEVERRDCKDRQNRLTIGLAVVSLIALGDLGTRVYMIAGG